MNLRDNIIFKDCGSVKAGYDSVYLCPLCHPTSSSDRAKGVEFRYALNKMNTVLDSLGLSSAVKSTRLVNYYDKMLLDSIRCDGCRVVIYKLIMNHLLGLMKLGLTSLQP